MQTTHGRDPLKKRSLGSRILILTAGLLLAGAVLLINKMPEKVFRAERATHSGEETERGPDREAPPSAALADSANADDAAPAKEEFRALHDRGVDREPRSQVFLRPLRRSSRGVPGFASAPRQGDPLAIALDHLRSTQRALGFTAADLDDPVVKDRFQSKHNQVTHIVLRQQFDGIEVYNADLSVNLMTDGRIVNLHNRFIPGLASEINLTEPVLSAEEAIARAAHHLEIAVTQPLAIQEDPDGPEQAAVFSGGGISRDPIPVKLTYFPSDNQETRLAWNMVVRMEDGHHWWDMNVDAETGAVLSKANWINGALYTVFPIPLQSPDDGPRTPLVDVHDPVASPFGWHDTDGVSGPEFLDTRGNNVEAQEDRDANDTGGFRPTPAPPAPDLFFNYLLDLTKEPAMNQHASIVNLFYWNNIIHDIHYHYGFDEVSGNFQQNNYGNGGLGGDPVQADTQDGSGTNNANFGTPPDGTDPRMQMYEFTSTTPRRDSSFDHMIVVHEYGHGVSNRLTGGASNASALTASQSRGMGEGWGDWWGLALTAKPAQIGATPRPVGTYVLGQDQLTGAGIRPFPYSTDFGVNAQTFGDLASGTLSVPHGIGTVWCATLWEMYWELVGVHGFDPDLYNGAGGNNIALQLVMDGLKLQPANPTYLDARDAILMADQVNSGGANRLLIWAAFARRGMGFSADDTGDPGNLEVTEAFDLPDDLTITPSGDFVAGGPPGGPFDPVSQTFTLTNTGTSSLSWEAVKSAAWTNLSRLGGTLLAGGSTDLVLSVDASAALLAEGVYDDTLTIRNVTSGFESEHEIHLEVATSSAVIATLPFVEDFETGSLAAYWEVTGTNEFRTQVTAGNAPHGGSFHLTMDDSVNGSLSSRNEVTLSIDLAGAQNVFLSFWAKEFSDEPDGPPPTPFVGGADFDGVAISENGTVWYELQQLRSLSVTYNQLTVDLDAALAFFGLNYTSNFRIRFNQFDNFSITTDGIAVDDITISGTVLPALLVDVPAEATEGDGVLVAQGTVSVPVAPLTDLTVVLSSANTDAATVPPSIVIPGGLTSANFDLTVIDDLFLDGTQSSTVAASATGYVGADDAILVLDDESATLSVTIPASATEGDGVLAGQGTVTSSAAPNFDVVVALASDDPTEVMVQATVTILAGQTSAPFDLAIADDGAIDGLQNATVTAHVGNWIDGAQVIAVADDEDTLLTISLPAEVAEGDGTLGGVGLVSLSGTLLAAGPAEVLLSNLAAPDSADLFAIGQPVSSPGQNFAKAISFTMPGQTYTLESLTLELADLETVDGSPLIAIHTNNAGAPGSLLSTLNGPVPALAGPPSAAYVFTSPTPVVLHANQTYWFTVGNTGTGAYNWRRSDPDTDPAGTAAFVSYLSSGDGGATWSAPLPQRLKFELRANPAPLTVLLASDDTGELTVPAQVPIPAGFASATFDITVIDDPAFDGRQTVNVSAAAAGFTPDNTPIDVTDNDVHHFAFAPVAGPQAAGTPFSVGVTAEDVNSETIAGYAGPAALTVAGDGGPGVVLPANTGSFSGGSWTGELAVNTIDTNVRITAADGPASGTSNAFDVELGPLDHFVWDLIPSPQEATVPFTVTITAVDAGGNTVPSFTGTVDLAGFVDAPPPTPPSPPDPDAAFASLDGKPVNAFVEADSEPAGTYDLSGEVSTVPAVSAFPPPEGIAPGGPCVIVNGDFETGDFTGWTLVNSGSGTFIINDGSIDPSGPDGPLAPCAGSFGAMVTQTGPGTHTLYQDVTLPVAASSLTLRWTDMIRNHAGNYQDPNQEYRVEVRDPADNSVLVDVFSTNPGDSSLVGCTVRSVDITAFAGQTVRIAFEEQDNLGYFNVHIDDVCIETGGMAVAVSPAVSGNFAGGVWTGDIAVNEPATDVALVAIVTGGSESGTSNTFDVTSPGLFAAWLAAYGLSGAGADPFSDEDGDQIYLSLEFFYNLDPFESAQTVYDPAAPVGPGGPVGLPLFEVFGTGPTARGRLTYPRRTTATLLYEGRFSGDLGNWIDGTPVSATPIISGWEEVIVDDPVPAGTPGLKSRSGRVEVTPQ